MKSRITKFKYAEYIIKAALKSHDEKQDSLLRAITNDDKEKVQILLNVKTDLNFFVMSGKHVSPYNYPLDSTEFPLGVALENGNAEIVQMLLNAGATVN